jgi:hypothetical protein
LAAGPLGLASMNETQCHFFLNLPLASWLLLGMTKGRAARTSAAATKGWPDPQLLRSSRPTSDSFSH